MIKFILTNIIILIIMFLRRPGGFLTPTLYFEDGATFLSQQLQADSWRMVFMPFTHGILGDSYYLFLTRLFTFLTSKLSLVYAPYIMNGAGFIIVSLSVSIFTLPVFRAVVKDDYLRAFFSILAATVLDGGEFFGTTTNFFWPLGIVLIYYLILPTAENQSKTKSLYFKFFIFFVIALSTPLSGLLLPFYCVKIALNRSRAMLPFLGILFGGSIELLVNFFYSKSTGSVSSIPDLPVLLEALVNGFAYRVTLPTFLGYDFSKKLLADSLGIQLFYLISFVMVVGVYWTSKNYIYKLNSILLLFFVCFLNFSLPFFKRNLWPFFYDLHGTFFWDAPRYFFLPKVCLALIVFIIIDSLCIRSISKTLTSIVFFGILLVNGFKLNEKAPDPTLNWFSQGKQIEQWMVATKNGSASEVSVPVYPNPVWKIELPGTELGQKSSWNWGDKINKEEDSVVISNSSPVAWKDLLILDEKETTLVVTSEYRCNVPADSTVKLKVTDTYGGEQETIMKYRKCGRIKDISIVLPKSRRRGLKISFQYEGERSVKLSDLRASYP